MPTTPKGIPTPSDAVKISALADAMRALGFKVDELLPPGLAGNSLSAGPVPNNSNLDTWTGNSRAGFWEVQTETAAATITGLPGPWAGTLLNLPGIGAQLYFPHTAPASLHYRAIIGSDKKLWNVWRKILTDADASDLRAAIADAKWNKGALPNKTDYRTLPAGGYYVATATTANSFVPPLPFGAAGNLEVSPGENYGRIVKFTTWGSSSRPNQSWQCERTAAGDWLPWKQTNAAVPLKHALTGSTNLDTLAPGFYWVPSYATAQLIKGLPAEASGDYIVYPGAYPRHEWITTGLNSRPNEKWQRETRADGTFTPWWRTDGAVPMRHALAGSSDLDTLAPGFYWVQSYAIAQLIKGLPAEASGDYIVYPGAYPRHEWITTGLNSRPNEKWQREKRGDGTFTPWWRTDARAVTAPSSPVSGAASAPAALSGFKVVPLNVTLDGNGASSKTVRTAREERLPMIWHAPIGRLKVHIGNQNLRSNDRSPGALSVTGLWIGQHAGAGAFTTAPQRLSGAFTTPADGSEWESPWYNYALIPGTEYLLNFGFTAPDGTEFFYHNGQSYASDNPANAGQIGHGAAGTARSIVDVWIEVETYATTPVIATVGSSSSAGVGADMPVQQNVSALVAAKLKALPMHYGGAGDTMANAANFDWPRWTRWAHLAKPDAVLNFMGSNDVFEPGMTLATLKARYLALAGYISANISRNVYLTTVTPRTTTTGPQEDLRRQYNAWLATLTEPRDVFDFAAAISTDNETIIPAYDSGDGYHFSTAGHRALAASVNRPITTPPVLYAAV